MEILSGILRKTNDFNRYKSVDVCMRVRQYCLPPSFVQR